jgi:tetratricopeptide (TPR) repeat protein
MGYRDVKVRTDDLMKFERPPNWSEDSKAVMIDAAYDSLATTLLKMVRSFWPGWLPGAAWLAWAAWQGDSMLWPALLLVLGLLHLIFLAMPSILYNQICWARVRGQYTHGLRLVGLLRVVGVAGAIKPLQLDGEKAKMLGGLGRVDEALALMARHQDDPNQVLYLNQIMEIHSAAGQREAMLAATRRLLEVSNNSQEVRIDLAWALMRYTPNVDEARQLIAGLHPSNCPELYAIGLRIVKGLIDQADGRHREALSALRREHDELEKYSLPLIAAIRAELRGYMALSLKASGQGAEAEALWQEVLPLVRVHHHDQLMERYQRAG